MWKLLTSVASGRSVTISIISAIKAFFVIKVSMQQKKSFISLKINSIAAHLKIWLCDILMCSEQKEKIGFVCLFFFPEESRVLFNHWDDSSNPRQGWRLVMGQGAVQEQVLHTAAIIELSPTPWSLGGKLWWLGSLELAGSCPESLR